MMCSAFLAGHYFIKETSYFYARLLSKKFWGFFCEHMGCRLLLFLVFPNRNLIIFVLSIHPNLPFFHQVSVWCSAV